MGKLSLKFQQELVKTRKMLSSPWNMYNSKQQLNIPEEETFMSHSLLLLVKLFLNFKNFFLTNLLKILSVNWMISDQLVFLFIYRTKSPKRCFWILKKNMLLCFCFLFSSELCPAHSHWSFDKKRMRSI